MTQLFIMDDQDVLMIERSICSGCAEADLEENWPLEMVQGCDVRKVNVKHVLLQEDCWRILAW